MNNPDVKSTEALIDWVNLKLRFIDGILREARSTSNYGKEIQYAGMRDAYLEFLGKLGAEKQSEQAA